MTTSTTIRVKTREELGLKENERPDGWCRFGYMDCFFGKTVPAEIDSETTHTLKEITDATG